MVVEWVTFRVRQGKEQEFEVHHQEWIRRLRRTRGFIGETLLRSVDDPSEYHDEVRWVSRDYRDRFHSPDDREGRALAQKGHALFDGAPSTRLLEQV